MTKKREKSNEPSTKILRFRLVPLQLADVIFSNYHENFGTKSGRVLYSSLNLSQSTRRTLVSVRTFGSHKARLTSCFGNLQIRYTKRACHYSSQSTPGASSCEARRQASTLEVAACIASALEPLPAASISSSTLRSASLKRGAGID